MTRAAMLLLMLGAALFVTLLAWQGTGAVLTALMAAGWGVAIVALYHLVPLVLDAGAISALFDRRACQGPTSRDAMMSRWIGEAVNSLLPAGQIGGPVLMVRQLSQRGMRLRDAAAAITVSTTVQAFAQIVFALLGLTLFSVYAAHGVARNLRAASVIATAVLAVMIVVLYVAQRRGLFGRLLRMLSKMPGKHDWGRFATRADAVDAAVRGLYDDRPRVAFSFALSLAGWLAGTAEVWLALRFLGFPVGWIDALLLESIGQAIRGAAFAIPGSLGVQEGGYLLLAPLVGLPADAALALSLVKRAREVLLGLPGLLYLHFSERSWQRRRTARVPLTD